MCLLKKQRERRALDIVLDQFVIAAADIHECEEPDFLFSLDGRTIGVEVTYLFLPSPIDAAKPLQATESEERTMVEMARQIAIEQGLPPQQLQVRLSQDVLDKQKRDRVAKTLFEYVASHCALPGECKFSESEELPPEIEYVRMYGLRDSAHQWNRSCAGWISSSCIDVFQEALTRKEALLAKYRIRCEICWLIVVASWDGASSFIEWSDTLESHEFSTDFERVFFADSFAGIANELQLSHQDSQIRRA